MTGCDMNEIKKIVAVIMLLAICFSLLPSCSKADTKLNGKTFEFDHARVGGEYRACSPEFAETYKDISVMEYTLKTEDGKLTITGEDITRTGEYKVYKLFDDSVLYEINVGDEPGFASLSEKKLEDGTVKYTLILTIRGYYVTFSSVNKSK